MDIQACANTALITRATGGRAAAATGVLFQPAAVCSRHTQTAAANARQGPLSFSATAVLALAQVAVIVLSFVLDTLHGCHLKKDGSERCPGKAIGPEAGPGQQYTALELRSSMI